MERLAVSKSELQEGSVNISGFKHSLVPILAGAALLDGKLTLKNCPRLEDCLVMTKILDELGAQSKFEADTLEIDCSKLQTHAIKEELSSRIHGSIYLLPAILARSGFCQIGSSGGCPIGDGESGKRPVEHILSLLKQFGARLEQTGPEISVACNKLQACKTDISDFACNGVADGGPLLSGATKTAILLAARAAGTSVIKNPLLKAETIDLLNFLGKAGLSYDLKPGELEISGTEKLCSVEYELPSDLIEIITFISLSVSQHKTIRMNTNSAVRVSEGLKAEFDLLQNLGVSLRWNDNELICEPQERISGNQDLQVSNNSIYSDSHPFFSFILLHAETPSRIQDLVWLHRTDYLRCLQAFGYQIYEDKGSIKIVPHSVDHISACNVTVSDVRSAAVAMLAALRAPGRTIIENTQHLHRGYVGFADKLKSLGASVEFLNSSDLDTAYH